MFACHSSELGVAGIWALNPCMPMYDIAYPGYFATCAPSKQANMRLEQSADLRATLLDVSPKRPGTQLCKERATGGIA